MIQILPMCDQSQWLLDEIHTNSFSSYFLFPSSPDLVCVKILSNGLISWSDKACLKSKDLEWYFLCPREKKYASGLRMNRATETGYWKTTGKDRRVNYNGNAVGMVRTLVFHLGSAPHGKRTDWVIHEYRIEDKSLADKEVAQVCCHIFI